jgi:hypothetical protein
VLVAAALGFGSLATRAPMPAPDAVVEIAIDAARERGRVVPIWDEVNLWKLHSLFGVQHTEDRPAGWLRKALPWVRYGRAVAALGGNWAPAIAPWCDHGLVAPEHPDNATGECGKDGAPGTAAQNELVREIDGTRVVDYAPLRLAAGRLVASGVLPHLNLSAVPAPFATGTDFTHYHWNAAPIGDLDGWREFVTGAFRALAPLDPSGWRVSITNEANCLTLVGWEQHRRHVGYAGSPEDYARGFATTAAAIRSVAPGVRLHAGNYVTSATFPGEDNLAEYLGALRAGLAAGDGPRWEDLTAVSLSLYETPDTTVYELVPIRVARAAAAVAAAGLAPLPFKIDELEVHPEIGRAFEARSGEASIDPTLWAASWHAEAIRAFVDDGRVASVAPWLGRLLGLTADGRTWRPFPKARAYALLGLLAGQLRTVDAGDGGVELVETGRDDGNPRLAVTGELTVALDQPRRRLRRAASIRALATRTDEGLRALVVHHRNWPVADRDQAHRRYARKLRVVADGLAPGAYAVRRLAIGGPGGTIWNSGRPTPLRWIDGGCQVAGGNALRLTAPGEWMEANTVWLIDVRHRDHCEARSRP